jgi:hypothetical protein
MSDMHIDRIESIREWITLISPERLIDRLSREDTPLRLPEKLHDIILLRGELDPASLSRYLLSIRVEDDICDLK